MQGEQGTGDVGYMHACIISLAGKEIRSKENSLKTYIDKQNVNYQLIKNKQNRLI